MKFSFKLNLKRGSKKKKNSILSSPVRPHKDWKMMLTVFFVASIAISALNAFLFWESSRNSQPVSEGQDGAKDKRPLDIANEFFMGREAVKSSSTDSFVDPSF